MAIAELTELSCVGKNRCNNIPENKYDIVSKIHLSAGNHRQRLKQCFGKAMK